MRLEQVTGLSKRFSKRMKQVKVCKTNSSFICTRIKNRNVRVNDTYIVKSHDITGSNIQPYLYAIPRLFIYNVFMYFFFLSPNKPKLECCDNISLVIVLNKI